MFSASSHPPPYSFAEISDLCIRTSQSLMNLSELAEDDRVLKQRLFADNGLTDNEER